MIFSLPEDFCLEFIGKWNSLKDIGNCDTAVCNKIHRSSFLIFISGKNLTVAADLNIRFIKWIILRNIRPVKFQVPEESDISEWIGIDCSEITCIKMFGIDWRLIEKDLNKFVDFLNSCTNWNRIECGYADILFGIETLEKVHNNILSKWTHFSMTDEYSEFLTDYSLTRLTAHCNNLVYFWCCFSNDEISEAALICFLKGNSRLTFVNISFISPDGPEKISAAFLPTFLDGCPLLSILILENVCEIDLNVMATSLSNSNHWIEFEINTTDQLECICLEKAFYDHHRKWMVIFGNSSSASICSFFSAVEILSLTSVDLHRLPNLTDLEINKIAPYLHGLEVLSIQNCDVSLMGLGVVLMRCLKLNHLRFESSEDIFTDDELSELSLLPNSIGELHIFQERLLTGNVDVLVDILKSHCRVKQLSCIRLTTNIYSQQHTSEVRLEVNHFTIKMRWPEGC
jgi:hypothetical protein